MIEVDNKCSAACSEEYVVFYPLICTYFNNNVQRDIKARAFTGFTTEIVPLLYTFTQSEKKMIQ